MLRCFRSNRDSSAVLFEVEIAGADVRVKFVFAISTLVERTKQAPVIFAKGPRLNAATRHGGLHHGIIRRVADANNQFARVKFNILVSSDVADFHLPRRHAYKKTGHPRNFDGALDVILVAAGNMQIPGVYQTLETNLNLPRPFPVLGGHAHRDLVVVPANQTNIARAHMDVKLASGREIYLEGMVSKVCSFSLLRLGGRYRGGC